MGIGVPLQRQKLVEYYSKGPHVGRLRVARAVDELGAPVVGRAAGRRRHLLVRLERAREAKVALTPQGRECSVVQQSRDANGGRSAEQWRTARVRLPAWTHNERVA